MTYTFRAMNTDVTVSWPALEEADEQRLTARVASLFAEKERRFSRFRHDSELARINRSAGPVEVSEEMFAALVTARRYTSLTRGAFDPAVGRALASLGYDRSFSPGALDRREERPIDAGEGTFLDVGLDAETRTVTRPEGVVIDLGGMIKGRTVDEAARQTSSPAAIDAGGDAVLRGAGPDGAGWIVDIEDPADDARVILSLAVTDRAVATSAPNRRRWRLGATDAHHLIDPRSRRPARADLAQVTVLAPRAELADVLAKSVFILGSVEGRALLEQIDGVSGVLVGVDGRVTRFGALEVVDA